MAATPATEAEVDLSQPQARDEEVAAAGLGGDGLSGGLRQAPSTAPHALSQGRDAEVEPQWYEEDNGNRVGYALATQQPPPEVTRLDLTARSNEGARSPRVSKARHMHEHVAAAPHAQEATVCPTLMGPGCNLLCPSCGHIWIQVRLDLSRQESEELSEGQESQSDTEAERQRQLHIQWQGQPPGGSALLIQVLQEATETSRYLDIDQPALRAAISAAEAAGTDGIAACLHVPSWRRHSPPALRPGARMAIGVIARSWRL